MYSAKDLKYAAEFREEIHREALAIVRKTHPDVKEVTDRHPVEDYFQQSWEYPGKWYTVVAVPYGYKSRQALVDAIVRDTLSARDCENVPKDAEELRQTTKSDFQTAINQPVTKPDCREQLFAEYPDIVVEYFIVKSEHYCGYVSHREALKNAFGKLCGEWSGDPGNAAGKSVPVGEMFSSKTVSGKLNYRKAFLFPPYENSYTDSDFERVNATLFPNGTDSLEVFEWTTEWSDYFDEGHEWWGTLCLTVYDKTLDRFVVIMASATD